MGSGMVVTIAMPILYVHMRRIVEDKMKAEIVPFSELRNKVPINSKTYQMSKSL
jgi:hypothetical protein